MVEEEVLVEDEVKVVEEEVKAVEDVEVLCEKCLLSPSHIIIY